MLAKLPWVKRGVKNKSNESHISFSFKWIITIIIICNLLHIILKYLAPLDDPQILLTIYWLYWFSIAAITNLKAQTNKITILQFCRLKVQPRFHWANTMLLARLYSFMESPGIRQYSSLFHLLEAAHISWFMALSPIFKVNNQRCCISPTLPP